MCISNGLAWKTNKQQQQRLQSQGTHPEASTSHSLYLLPYSLHGVLNTRSSDDLSTTGNVFQSVSKYEVGHTKAEQSPE